MKKFISLILPCFIAPAMGFAQIELKSDDQSTVISFGKSDEASAVQIGKADNSGALLLQGSEGFRIVSGNQTKTDVISYDTKNPEVVTFNAGISTLGLLAKTPSGNAQCVENAVDLLSAVPMRLENEGSPRYFLDAEDVANSFPGLVITSEDGSQSIDYVGVVSLLVGAVQELNSELAALKGETNGTATILSAKAALQQNQPNPAKDTTVIKYTLPDGCVDASVCVFDLQGALAKSLTLDAASGSSQIIISTSDIQPGMYLYSLIVDGNVAATKKMIVTR